MKQKIVLSKKSLLKGIRHRRKKNKTGLFFDRNILGFGSLAVGTFYGVAAPLKLDEARKISEFAVTGDEPLAPGHPLNRFGLTWMSMKNIFSVVQKRSSLAQLSRLLILSPVSNQTRCMNEWFYHLFGISKKLYRARKSLAGFMAQSPVSLALGLNGFMGLSFDDKIFIYITKFAIRDSQDKF